LFLTETLKKKLLLANVSDENISVSFDRDFPYPRTKIIKYKDISNKVNVCPVIIKGTQEQLAFAWNVGVGNSTGIGFGALK
jgi:CRISPR-associated endoribonuclease Cas6